MDPKGPAQPNIDTSYDTAGNPAEKTSHEKSKADAKAYNNTGATAEDRGPGDIPVPSTHNDGATPSSLGIGATDASGDLGENVGSQSLAHITLTPDTLTHYKSHAFRTLLTADTDRPQCFKS